MARFLFAGRVFPLFNEFCMEGCVNAHFEAELEPTAKLVMDASVMINKGVIQVTCESNLFGTEDYDGQVDWRANHLVRSVVSSYAFATATHLEPVLESVIKPDGIKYNIQARREALRPLVTALHVGSRGGNDIVDIKPLLTLALQNPTIFVALKDLVDGINAGETVVNCGRAIEGLRTCLAPANDRKAGWRIMRDNLNITQSFLEFITDQSKGPRHGDVYGVQFSAINETVRRAWIIMNRFLEFKKRGEKQLPLSEFPLLDK
jgi:hypothetical protein